MSNENEKDSIHVNDEEESLPEADIQNQEDPSQIQEDQVQGQNDQVQGQEDQVQDQMDPGQIQQDRLAGFWMRMWAFLADLIIVFSINGLLLSPLHFLNEGIEITISVWTLHGILASIVSYLYFLILTKKTGQTLGKMIFGLRVVRMDHEALQWSDLLFREVVVRFCYKVFWFLNLLYLVVAFQKNKQGIHDMIGQTKVIHVD